MPVTVRFPDGSVREMPSERVEVSSGTPGRAAIVIERPLPSKDWRFVASADGWLAQPPRRRNQNGEQK